MAQEDRPAGVVPAATDIRTRLVENVLTGVFIVALLGTPASMLRALSTGWLPLYGFHLVLGLMVALVFAFRKRLSLDVKARFILGVFFLIGIVGMFTLGLLGAGLWWLLMATLLISTVYSVRAGVWTLAFVTCLVILAGYCFANDIVRVPVDPNAYMRNWTSWLNLLFATTLMPFVVFQSIAVYQQETTRLLHDIEVQRQEITRFATHDQLTGLVQLNLAVDRLQQALKRAERTSGKVALLFIDLDGFKAVNDSHGHDAGDLVLKVVASRLRSALRDSDTAARIGGDEFVLVIGEVARMEVVTDIASRVLAEVAAPISYEGCDVRVGCSIGIALYPDHAVDAVGLRKAADAAMYAVKRAGKGGFQYARPGHAAAGSTTVRTAG